MKRVLARGISVLLMGWVLSAPVLISVHSTFYHNRLGTQATGLCSHRCTDDGHRNPRVKHDWCQVRVFNYLKNCSRPVPVSFGHPAFVPPVESVPPSVSPSLLPPSRAS
ncbi:MAG: hypothetical protein ACE5HZ_08800, partial [Fidelibacterota bacterium]